MDHDLKIITAILFALSGTQIIKRNISPQPLPYQDSHEFSKSDIETKTGGIVIMSTVFPVRPTTAQTRENLTSLGQSTCKQSIG